MAKKRLMSDAVYSNRLDGPYVGDGCMAITDSLRTEVARITNVRSGRGLGRQIAVPSGGFRISYPPVAPGDFSLALRLLSAGRLRSPTAGLEHPGRKIRIWLTGRFGEMRRAGMGTQESVIRIT